LDADDPTLMGQTLQSRPDGDAGDGKLAGQYLFARQGIGGTELTSLDALFQNAEHTLLQRHPATPGWRFDKWPFRRRVVRQHMLAFHDCARRATGWTKIVI
jgi:hypothetical protein